jgi:ATP-binding cassette subfamily F protein uup
LEKKSIENELSQGLLGNEELLNKSKRHGEIMKILDERELRWLELSEK